MATIIDGNELSKKKRQGLAQEAQEFIRRHGRAPGLAVVLVGEDPASAIYVRNKKKACEATSIRSFDYQLDAGTKREDLLALVNKLNADPEVDGILVQLPLPSHLDSQEGSCSPLPRARMWTASIPTTWAGCSPANPHSCPAPLPGSCAC